jgi:hypothetical protein
MTKHLIKTLIVTAGIAAVPTLSSAASAPVAMDNCVKAFMASLSTHTVPLKLRESHYLNTGMFEGNLSELVLIANDAHDNHTIGRAICRVDSHGQIVQLEEVPANALSPL